MSVNGPRPTPEPEPPLVLEVVQIPNAHVEHKPLGRDLSVLCFTLPYGRQYQFILNAEARLALSTLLTPVKVFGPGDMP